ncbi:unnamed protein product, partial [Nesidiocoris tenuis]
MDHVYRGEQKGLPRMVRAGPDVRDPQDAVLLSVLLQAGPAAPLERFAHARRPRRDVREAGKVPRGAQVFLQSEKRRRRGGIRHFETCEVRILALVSNRCSKWNRKMTSYFKLQIVRQTDGHGSSSDGFFR